MVVNMHSCMCALMSGLRCSFQRLWARSFAALRSHKTSRPSRLGDIGGLQKFEKNSKANFKDKWGNPNKDTHKGNDKSIKCNKYDRTDKAYRKGPVPVIRRSTDSKEDGRKKGSPLSFAAKTSSSIRKSKVIRTPDSTKKLGPSRNLYKSSIQRDRSPKKGYKSPARLGAEFFSSLPSKFRLNPSSNLTLMDYEGKRESRWNELGLSPPTIISALDAMLIKRPNPMQACVIPELNKSRASVLFAAETGSGKTLAYLAPIMAKLKMEEQQSEAECRVESSPRALILVPSNELVEQVYSVAKTISHHVKLRVEKLSGASNVAIRERSATGLVDLVVATPAQLLLAQGDSILHFDHVNHVAIDEADTLLTAEFGDQVASLLSLISSNPLETRAVCSATIPCSLSTKLNELFPEILKLGSPDLHKPSQRVNVRFLPLHRPGDAKLKTLVDLLKLHRRVKTLVFCNRAGIAHRLHRQISEDEEIIESIGNVPSLLHGSIPEKQRHSILNKFLPTDSPINVLICTDLASRGIDTLDVGHVIMYDFPRNTIDFIHRLGRTGRRRTSRGLVNCFFTKKDEALAKAIKRSIKSGGSLTGHFNE